ncbi:MAG: DEAD/DEAH box helicase family protein, partial [Candidatus Nanoarchaeia archaeon]|nr:DEAD/DEAH box helicase family protein [Candidatus Nanoarchaeia archaeon]
MKLRDYQKEALHSIINLYNSNITKQLIVLPTGSGKTVIIAAILKFFNKKTLVISHRKEIIKQTINTIKRFCDTDVGIYLGKEKDLNHKIIVGSIQTCCISKELLKEQFDILIIDEAHHSAAKTYKKLIDELGFGDNSSKLLIGFTATPNL